MGRIVRLAMTEAASVPAGEAVGVVIEDTVPGAAGGHAGLVQGLPPQPDPVMGVLDTLTLPLEGVGPGRLVLAGVHKAGGHEHGDGDTEHGEQNVHPDLERGHGVMEARLRDIGGHRSWPRVLGIQPGAHPAVLVLHQDIGQDGAQITHVH